MKFRSVCITTDDVFRLAEFYKIVLGEEPFAEGSHYSFSSINIWNPGDGSVTKDKNTWMIFDDANIDALYDRLLRDIPNIKIISPPERKPWGAYAFWFADPDGNRISVFEERKDNA